MWNNQIELSVLLFELRTPLYGIRAYADHVSDLDGHPGNITPEIFAWLEKWIPKADTWLSEVQQLTRNFGETVNEDQDWMAQIRHLYFILDGVEVAATEANDIAATIAHDHEVFLDAIVKSTRDIDKTYRHMRDLLTPLK